MTVKFERRYLLLLMILIIGFLARPGIVVSQEAAAPILLMKIEIEDKVERTAITIITDNPVDYKVSEIEKSPLYKIVLDLNNTQDGWKKSLEVKQGVVFAVSSSQYQETPPLARVVLDLVEKVPYRVSQKENKILVEVDNPYSGKVSPRMAEIVATPVPTAATRETPAVTPTPTVAPTVTPLRVYQFTGVEVKEVENQVEVYINLDGPVKYQVKKLSPLSLIVDLPQTKNLWKAGKMTVEKGAVARIRSSQWKDEPLISRVVLDFNQAVSYRVTTVGNRIRIAVTNPAEVLPAKAPATPSPAPTPQVVATPAGTSVPAMAVERLYTINRVEVQDRPAENRQLIIISADGPINFQVEKQSDPLVIGIYIPQAVDGWKKAVQVREEGAIAQVSTVSVDRPEKAVKVLIGLKRPVAFYPLTGPNQVLVYVDKYLARPPEVEVKPVVVAPVGRGYVTVSFADADIRDVIALFAEIGEVSVIAGPEIAGKVTCTFKNEPWEKALGRTLEVMNFGYTRDGKIVSIKTVAKIKEEEDARNKAEEERLARIQAAKDRQLAEEKRVREEEEAAKQYVPTVTERIDLNYSKVDEIGPLVQVLLSSRGRWQKFGNSLLVTDIAEQLEAIKVLVAELDRAEPEILITVKIAIVDNKLIEQLGIQWNAAGGNVAELSSKPAGANQPTQGTLQIGAITTESFTATMQALRDKSLILSSRDTYIRVKNNLTGTITETVSYPYPLGGTTGGWSFSNVVTMLTATPHVNPAEEITLDLSPTISDVIATTAGGPPTTRSSSTNTTTRVRNGETIVIGGLLQTGQTTGQTGVPFLSQIPIIGALFRSSKSEEHSSQILLFITPQIIKEGSGL